MIFVKRQEAEVTFSRSDTCSAETHFEFSKKLAAIKSDEKKTIRLVIKPVISAT
jgi:hypothetical protein